MRDGIELSTDLHLPPGGLSGGPYPLVLMRTPANNHAAADVKKARQLSEHGFAVAIQDVRGREDSGGEFCPFRDEGRDGYDSVEWFAAQEWCTGKVGMMGTGYAGWAQWAAARELPPHLVTLVSTASWGGRRAVYRNGAVVLPMLSWLHAMSARVWQHAGQVDWERVLRHLPLRTMDQALGRDIPVWREWLDHPRDDDYWRPLDFSAGDFRGIALPALHITGWHDSAQGMALHLFEGMRAHSPAAAAQALIIGPWDHAGTQAPTQVLGGVDFGASAVEDIDALHLRWFEHWLSDGGEDAPAAPDSKYFVTGTNVWREEAWSPSAESAVYYLHSGGAANTVDGDGTLTTTAPTDEPPDSYQYDPADPIVVTPDFTFFPSPPAQPPQLPLDRRFVERRPDVLVFTSPELTQEVEVLGRPSVHLYAGSDRPDTDWFVQLSDVDARGASIVLAMGVLRAGRGLEPESVMSSGEVDEVRIELDAVAHVVQPGHRLRASVMSSCFPLYDRNANTGDPTADDGPHVATNHVRHDAAHPSRLVLPIRSGSQGSSQ
jgi:hypothetical protein